MKNKEKSDGDKKPPAKVIFLEKKKSEQECEIFTDAEAEEARFMSKIFDLHNLVCIGSSIMGELHELAHKMPDNEEVDELLLILDKWEDFQNSFDDYFIGE